MKNKDFAKFTTRRICTVAVFMALYIAFCSFSVPVPGGHLYLNDIVICVAAIILDPVSAFMVGGVGAFLGDLIFYPLPMFVSLVTHGLQAVVISLFSHYFMKKRPIIASTIGVSIGAVIMVAGYTFGKIFIYSTLEYAILKLPYEIMQALIGVVFGLILCWKTGLVKLAKKQGIYFEAQKKKKENK
jgi:uncharacterized membrane protein